MNELQHPTLILLYGWAGGGKTAVAKHLEKRFGIPREEIDDVRERKMGRPKAKPETPDELEKEAVDMLKAYGLLAEVVDQHLAENRSLIITATFSKQKYWEIFRPIFKKHPHATIKIIQCVPVNDTPENVERILRQREREGYNSAVNTPERYYDVKGRFTAPPFPFHPVLTWGSENSIEKSARQATEHILA